MAHKGCRSDEVLELVQGRRCHVSRKTHYAVRAREKRLQRQVEPGLGASANHGNRGQVPSNSAGNQRQQQRRHHPVVVTLGSLSPNGRPDRVVELPPRKRKFGFAVRRRTLSRMRRGRRSLCFGRRISPPRIDTGSTSRTVGHCDRNVQIKPQEQRDDRHYHPSLIFLSIERETEKEFWIKLFYVRKFAKGSFNYSVNSVVHSGYPDNTFVI